MAFRQLRLKTSIVQDAYVSIDVEAEALMRLSRSLCDLFEARRVPFELASESPHVSVAYGIGEASYERVCETVQEISRQSFRFRALEFAVFEGRRTPYDYLVLKVEDDDSLAHAQAIARRCLGCHPAIEKLNPHISLLRFPKSPLNSKAARELVAEMNASRAAAFAIGKTPCLSGVRVNVYDLNYECCLTASIGADRHAFKIPQLA